MADSNQVNFQRLVSEHAQRARGAGVDWNARKEAWLDKVGELYALIETWLEPLVENQILDIRRGTTRLSEELIGSYEAPMLNISVRGTHQRLQLTPVGTTIIGAAGRVDVEGPNGTAMLVIVVGAPDDAPSNQRLATGTWAIASRGKSLAVPLDEQSFQSLYLQVTGIA